MERTVITNSEELRSVIQQLKMVDAEQQAALGQRFKDPMAIFVTAKSLFPKPTGQQVAVRPFQLDVVDVLSRFVIPPVLNNTVFRNSNFIMKAFVRLIAPKVVKPMIKGPAEQLLTKTEYLLSGWLGRSKNKPEPRLRNISN